MSALKQNFIEIVSVFENLGEEETNLHYRNVLLNRLRKILPESYLLKPDSDYAKMHHRLSFHALLPHATYSSLAQAPGNISFFVLSKYRSSSFKFFFEMVSRWLIPGKRLNVVLVYATDFRLPEISDEVYTVCEVMIQVTEQEELELIRKNFPIIQTEICLGTDSAYYARRILEIKGLTADEKTAVLHEYIASLLKRRPQNFDQDIIAEMQHLLVLCHDNFKASRTCRHLSRIIGFQYLFRKNIRAYIIAAPFKRHVVLKIFNSEIQTKNEKTKVLAISLGLNFLREKEIFEERHLLRTIQTIVPGVISVEGSFFMNKRDTDNIGLIYLEVKKENNERFSIEEIRKLRKDLPRDLKNRIERVIHPVFMPRNEEEIMRNILLLSEQIRFVRDIPQVFISFDEQTDFELFFTVILVRVVKDGSKSVQELFEQTNTCLEYMHDQKKIIGYMRKKYPKESTVFQVKIAKEEFIRDDHFVDLYKARQAVAAELVFILGQYRDFNGGMISKQNELLEEVKGLLRNASGFNKLLLENFFYSLQPVVKRTVIDPQSLKILFGMLLEASLEGLPQEGFLIKMIDQETDNYVIILTDDVALREEVQRTLQKMQLEQSELTTAIVKFHDFTCLGYIFHSDEPAAKTRFNLSINQAVDDWHKKNESLVITEIM